MHVPSPFFASFRHSVMHIVTADAPDTRNRLQRIDEEVSRHSSHTSAKEFLLLGLARVRSC